MLVNAMLNPFIIHLDKAHLEETPGQQVQGLLDPNTYVQLHTVMLEDMLMPAITAIQNSLNGIDPLITHIDKAHLEETPGQQVNQLLNTDSYVQLHTVMVEDMINPLTQSLTGTYGC
jgi:tyrosine-protein phosphatase YwqE